MFGVRFTVWTAGALPPGWYAKASFDGAIGHFVDCLASGAAFETDVLDNLETLRLVDQAYAATDAGPGATSDRSSNP